MENEKKEKELKRAKREVKDLIYLVRKSMREIDTLLKSGQYAKIAGESDCALGRVSLLNAYAEVLNGERTLDEI